MGGILSTVIGSFLGKKKRPPVFTTTATASSRYATLSTPGLQMRDIEVLDVIRETDDAVTIQFKLASGEPLRYKAGQFLTFVLTLNGEEVRRAYSFSSCPLDNTSASVTVKRIQDGLVSSYMNSEVKPGDLLKILGPSGEFCVAPAVDAKRKFVFVGGGSGITPLMSLAQTLLRREPNVEIDLLYGNRGHDDIIFRDRLIALAAEHPNLRIHHVLENPADEIECSTGLLTGEKLLELTGDLADKTFYICGPEAMMDGAVEALREAGIEDDRIKTERFTAPAQRSGARPAESYPITFSLTGRTITPKPGETILEAGLNAGIPLDYSCAMGGCAACKLKVTDGEVYMDEPNCLSPAEKEKGYVLACVGCASSPITVEA